MGRLENRIALVTGAGQGIGRAIALAIAHEGAALVIGDLNETNASAVKKEIEGLGGKAAALHADISNEESVQAMVDATLKEPGLTATARVMGNYDETEWRRIGQSLPMGRAAEPSEIAEAVGFLASEESGYITGQIIHVNGGMIFN